MKDLKWFSIDYLLFCKASLDIHCFNAEGEHFFQQNWVSGLGFLRFKVQSTVIWFLMLFRKLVLCFQNFSKTYNLGQNCWDKLKNPSFKEKTPLPPNQCCKEKFLDWVDETWPGSTLILGGKGEKMFSKSWYSYRFYSKLKICLNKFCPWL